jgi:hypothetical protein
VCRGILIATRSTGRRSGGRPSGAGFPVSALSTIDVDKSVDSSVCKRKITCVLRHSCQFDEKMIKLHFRSGSMAWD